MAYGRRGKLAKSKKGYKRRVGKRVGNKLRKRTGVLSRTKIIKALSRGRKFTSKAVQPVISCNHLGTAYGHGRDIVFGVQTHGMPYIADLAFKSLCAMVAVTEATGASTGSIDLPDYNHPFNDTTDGDNPDPSGMYSMKPGSWKIEDCWESHKLTNFGNNTVFYKVFKYVAKNHAVPATYDDAADFIGTSGVNSAYVATVGPVPDINKEIELNRRGRHVAGDRYFEYNDTPTEAFMRGLFKNQLISKPPPKETRTTVTDYGTAAESMVTGYHANGNNAGNIDVDANGYKFISGQHGRFGLGSLGPAFNEHFSSELYATGKIAAGGVAYLRMKHRDWTMNSEDMPTATNEGLMWKKGATVYVFQMWGEPGRSLFSDGSVPNSFADQQYSLSRSATTVVNVSSEFKYGLTLTPPPIQGLSEFWVAQGPETLINANDKVYQGTQYITKEGLDFETDVV